MAFDSIGYFVGLLFTLGLSAHRDIIDFWCFFRLFYFQYFFFSQYILSVEFGFGPFVSALNDVLTRFSVFRKMLECE